MSIEYASKQIARMYILDQESWKKNIDNKSLIIAQTRMIKKIVERFGCIDIKRFGEKICHYAWLLVQHSNHDTDFQEQYLKLMKKSDNVLKRDIAYLTDRIAVLKGYPQKYGTQFDPSTINDIYSPYPIKDPLTVNLRRSKMGLEPIEKYIKYMRKKYRKIV